ncbi:septum site-determining protein MinC [Anopheles sinensis]|uniref:Septum site-determining protein MinC n=1 Tax=Anopheles sinensis TaxID=74873 RepID=A0A084WUB2_ANOSI|nr:septum site-determining protein MinC [Anopheles sinensis]
MGHDHASKLMMTIMLTMWFPAGTRLEPTHTLRCPVGTMRQSYSRRGKCVLPKYSAAGSDASADGRR